MPSRILFGLLIAVAGASVGCAPEPGRNPVAAAPDRTVNWPMVDGFERKGPQRFDDPRLGYSLSYLSATGLTVTVYLYDRGLPAIADGDSESARDELANAIADIGEAKRRGLWKSVGGGEPKRASLGARPGAPMAWTASFRLGRDDGGEALSDLSVTGRRGEFVKIRCTYLPEDRAACERERAVLMDALGEALKP